jgi:hypothetical protein
MLMTGIQTVDAQTATFTFKTVTPGGSFSPRHVLAVWIEKEDGTFVKTLFLRAAARKAYLYTWLAKSSNNVVDAITGTTLTSHQSHTVQWNCKDLTGNWAPDGNYKIVVEFTDQHAQGPIFSQAFTKSSSVSTISPANQTNFIDMNFVFDPLGVGFESFDEASNAIEIFPNPSHGNFNIRFNSSMLQSGNLQILDYSGRIIESQFVANQAMNALIPIDLSKHAAGIYLLVFKSEGQIAVRKLLLW